MQKLPHVWFHTQYDRAVLQKELYKDSHQKQLTWLMNMNISLVFLFTGQHSGALLPHGKKVGFNSSFESFCVFFLCLCGICPASTLHSFLP